MDWPKVIDKLIKATNDGKADWVEKSGEIYYTEKSGEIYYTLKRPKGTIVLEPSKFSPGVSSLYIKDDEGRLVEDYYGAELESLRVAIQDSVRMGKSEEALEIIGEF